MKDIDKKEELNKILEDKFKYTNDVLSDNIIEVFEEPELNYYDMKQKDRLISFKYSLIIIPVFVIVAIIYHYIFKN